MKSIWNPAYRSLIFELRQARQRRGLTQAAAGQLLGRSRQWVHKIETCEIRLDVAQVIQVCRSYGIKAYQLVRRLEEESEEGASSYLLRRTMTGNLIAA